jgi:hypothetical protein
MPYRRSNYDLVIDSSFQPFSMQEMLVPFTAYKEAYEKDEAAYIDLQNRADKFKYLSETLPEGSKARQIYEGYANQLSNDAKDFMSNGKSMSNARSLLDLKRRYQGEIGRLVDADTALKQEQALRRQMSAKDPSMLYAVDNLSIDNYLDNQTPNLYGISGTDLYTKAAAASQSMSKRQFSVNGENKTLGGYYYDYVQRMGYTPEDLRKFGDQISADFAAQVSTLPELQQAANQILEANGVNENLTGNNLRKAQQQVIRGLIDGAVYSEQHNPQRNLGVMTATEKTADARAREGMAIQRESMNRQAAAQGLTWNPSTNSFDYDIRKDPKHSGDLWMYDVDETTGQIKGYSKAYEDAVNKGIVKGGGKQGGSTGSTNTPKEPLKANVVYDGSGNVSPVKTGQNAPTWGRRALSFDEAVQINPYIKDHHPGYEKDYDYYINGNSVTIIAHGKTANAAQQEGSVMGGISNSDDEY